MKPQQKTLTLWIVVFLFLALFARFAMEGKKDYKQITYSEFISLVEGGQIKEVTFKGEQTILGQFIEGHDTMNRFRLTGDTGESSFKLLRKNGITPNYEEEEKRPLFTSLLINWGPMILLIVIFYFFLRQIQAGGGKAMSFGKSKAKMLNASDHKINFSDVAGVEEAKEELKEIVDFLKEPKKYTILGGKIPKGVILIGPPGTGKTLLARAVAGEAGVPFFSISGSDFVEMFVGVGASRVRDLFEQGKKNAPCMIFVDEIDAVGRHRGSGLGGGHDEREQTLNQLLVEMDGFESNEGVILVAATNRMDVLDPALLRPGRFDRRVTVGIPDVRGRLGILKVHTKKNPLSDSVNLESIAKGTPGFTGADLANLVNEAALQAAKMDKKHLENEDFEYAKDKVLMGPERRSMIISDKEKRVTAYHEAGHVLVGMNLPSGDPIHKVSIVPRGQALGVTQFLPDEEMHNMTKEKANNYIATLMGGRSAEELILGEITNGASNDIERSTTIARTMVCHWGMSEKIGPINFKKTAMSPFSHGEQSDYSEKMANQIDDEVYRIIDENHQLALQILKDNKDALERIAKALIIWETLNFDQIKLLVAGKDIGVPTFNKNEEDSKPEAESNDESETENEASVDKTLAPKAAKIIPTT